MSIFQSIETFLKNLFNETEHAAVVVFATVKPTLQVLEKDGAADLYAIFQKEIQDFRDKKTWQQMYNDGKALFFSSLKDLAEKFVDAEIAAIQNLAEAGLQVSGAIPAPAPLTVTGTAGNTSVV